MKNIIVSILVLFLFGCSATPVVNTPTIEQVPVQVDKIISTPCILEQDIPTEPQGHYTLNTINSPVDQKAAVVVYDLTAWKNYAKKLKAIVIGCSK